MKWEPTQVGKASGSAQEEADGVAEAGIKWWMKRRSGERD
jgi:hypothetical protein